MKVSTRQLSELTGVDRPRIASRLRDLPHETGPNRAHLFDSRQALRAIYSADGDGPSLDPSQERARLDRLRADEVETRLASSRRELIPAADYERALAGAFKVVAQTLESLPDVLERDAGLDGAGVERCQSVIDRVRDELYQKLAA